LINSSYVTGLHHCIKLSSVHSYSQHLQWIKKVNQSFPKMTTCNIQNSKGFDPLQMLTSVFQSVLIQVLL